MESNNIKVNAEPEQETSPIRKSEIPYKVNQKCYKQAYRKEWELMPDFKGWLKGVPGEPTRAYCTHCQKTLHAHRLSLLKHTCTIRHTRAAHQDFALKKLAQVVEPEKTEKENKTLKEENDGSSIDGNIDGSVEGSVDMASEEEDILTSPRVTEVEVNVILPDVRTDEIMLEKNKLPEKPEGSDQNGGKQNLPAKKIPQVDMASALHPEGPLSTHVLDTAKGNPVSGLQVSLYKLVDGRWTHISDGMTNPDGRYTEFIQRSDFVAGRYKLHFDVDRYFEIRKMESLYPFIEIVFDVKSPQDHYHVPLLLSPFGYTTYRGS